MEFRLVELLLLKNRWMNLNALFRRSSLTLELCNILDGQTPRTPTPFKNALAELERRSGATTQLPVTPSRLDALTEIIKQETDRESLASTSGLLQDSGYSTGRRRGKENSAPGGKRARKALSQAWSSSNDNNSEMSFAVETPVRIFKQKS